MKTEFSAPEVSRLAGFAKPWMLSYLERESIFCRQKQTDKRHGRARKYTFADIVVLRAINRLLEMGARPSRIKTILRELGNHDQLKGSRKQVERLATSVGTRLLVSDSNAYIVDDEKHVVDLLASGQFAFGFMLEFHECFAPVVGVVQKYERKREKLWKQNELILDELCKAAGI